MPELPEIESLRIALAQQLCAGVVTRATLHRKDILHVVGTINTSTGGLMRDMPLPVGSVIKQLHRHGKQMVIETMQDGCLLVHLGMSGSLRLLPLAEDSLLQPEKHVHAIWHIRCKSGEQLVLRHRDPRRFGWLESHPNIESIQQTSWNKLGPDALLLRSTELLAAVAGSTRPLKSVLLDQAVTAGIGNIYADESLFRARLHPCMHARRLTPVQAERLVRVIRDVLREAVQHGGSTIQDHRTAAGGWGTFQKLHRVYGRAGLPCRVCKKLLSHRQVQQRTTVFCTSCQTQRPKR